MFYFIQQGQGTIEKKVVHSHKKVNFQECKIILPRMKIPRKKIKKKKAAMQKGKLERIENDPSLEKHGIQLLSVVRQKKSIFN